MNLFRRILKIVEFREVEEQTGTFLSAVTTVSIGHVVSISIGDIPLHNTTSGHQQQQQRAKNHIISFDYITICISVGWVSPSGAALACS